jgi:hypothetical protein
MMAGALVGLVDLGYLAMVMGQPRDGGVSLRIPFVAGFIGLMALAVGLSAWRRLEGRAPLLLSLAAIGLLATGMLAIFSIGIVLLVAAVPVFVAGVQAFLRSRQPSGWLHAMAGAAVAVGVLIVGLQLTEVPIACPATGYESGSGPGLFSSPYHWSCVNGTLTVAAGECTHGGATVDASGKVVATTGC